MLSRCLAACLVVFAAFAANAQNQRHFQFHYSFTVKSVPAGEPLKVWIPLAHSDAFQDVRLVSQKGDLPLRTTTESEYGNSLLYAETPHAKQDTYQFTLEYDVVRHETRVLASGKPGPDANKEPAQRALLARFLEPDRLVPITGVPAELAVEQTKGAETPLARANAMYDYVFKTLRYDKSGTGWGNGDAIWACDAKRGNCTDFHSLFIAMARSQKIPSRFEIGFSIPTDKPAGDIAGYHCWADFYTSDLGWVPVDISEAWKHQEKHDYFFGSRDADRVQFTVGRDLRLDPPQAGPPLNYLIYPYVEVDGKQLTTIDKAFGFKEETTEKKVAGTN
jgi:transglutaminase-like putative cysteine protease